MPRIADERTALTSRLDWLRATAVAKVAGLTEEQGRTAVSPSDMTPMGLLHHMTATERWWFSIDFAASREVPPPWPEDEQHDGFTFPDTATVPELVAAYEAECERSRAVVAATPGLDAVSQSPTEPPFDLRYLLVHMIDETSRHCGHLDYMREALDGGRGY
ncbi:uncharacterized protein DUF664 [Stackebrandtia albiflava]|uniref:Uncharacterized protein DUF664 n=1 Tax=Stackebrandtia albiflava TaxID=406432 RepID=A0A562VA16_9ACTN|nr:uncharacterized protein DUF664 [Stackebrandtia albiflava]